MALRITPYDIEQLFININKVLKYLDGADLNKKALKKIHGLIDPKSERFRFVHKEHTWGDLLINVRNLAPKNATEEELQYLTDCFENLTRHWLDFKPKDDLLTEAKAKPKEPLKPDVKIIKKDGRFVIVDSKTNKVIDDAKGYGYKNFTSARKMLWYIFEGGKEKYDEARRWWKAHKEIKKAIIEFIKKKELQNYKDQKSKDFNRVLKRMEKLCIKNDVKDFNSKFIKALNV